MNQSRPLLGGSSGLYVGAKQKNIGSTVTDITTFWGPKKDPVYLSLKYGSTLTFINSGVGRIFTPNDYKTFFQRLQQSNRQRNFFEMFGDRISFVCENI